MHAPSAIAVDPEGSVYVVDTGNDRVLTFQPPLQSGMEANSIFGSNFHIPTSIKVDPLNRGIWVMDFGNHMIELWSKDGSRVKEVLLKPQYTPDGYCGQRLPDYLARIYFSTRICGASGGIAFDGAGNMLVADTESHDVYRFPRSSAGNMLRSQPNRRLFFPPPGPNLANSEGMNGGRGMVIYGDQLVVSSYGRLLFWNGLDSLSNGKPADGVVGARHHRELLPCCDRIKVDDAGRLWVPGLEGRDYVDVYELPLTEYSAPIHTIWLENNSRLETTSFPVLGSEDQITLGSTVRGVSPLGSSDSVWLSDTYNHRVVRVRNPLTNPIVDVILGQEDPDGTKCNRRAHVRPHSREDLSVYVESTENMICFPGALSIDQLGNLYVSDHTIETEGNFRLLSPAIVRC